MTRKQDILDQFPELVRATATVGDLEDFIQEMFIPTPPLGPWSRVAALTMAHQGTTLAEMCNRPERGQHDFLVENGLCDGTVAGKRTEGIEVGHRVDIRPDSARRTVDEMEFQPEDLVWINIVVVDDWEYSYVPKRLHGVFKGPWEWWNEVKGDNVSRSEFERVFEEEAEIPFPTGDGGGGTTTKSADPEPEDMATDNRGCKNAVMASQEVILEACADLEGSVQEIDDDVFAFIPKESQDEFDFDLNSPQSEQEVEQAIRSCMGSEFAQEWAESVVGEDAPQDVLERAQRRVCEGLFE